MARKGRIQAKKTKKPTRTGTRQNTRKKTPRVAPGTSEQREYDVFISHASEDKQDVVTPLSIELMRRGIVVWLDALQLTLGDGLRKSIDEGLGNSRFGVVVLSPSFFANKKKWTKKELDALVAREDGSEKVILPIWHSISHDDIAKYSPLLADKVAISTEKGLEAVANEIQRVVSPDTIPDQTAATSATAGNRQSRKADRARTKQATAEEVPRQPPALNELLTRKSAARDDLREVSEEVNKQQEPATVVFLDLVASSGFRVSAGAERGLEKAYQHNLIVSDAIIEGGGIVVKWLGDGVMGVFRGEGKTWPAFRAALAAIDRLVKYNSDNFPNDSQQADRIITRVGICDGPVHFLTVPAAEGRPALTIDDPIGTPADLASRLQSLAGDSVILLSDAAFQQIVTDGDVNSELIPLHREPRLARTYRPATAMLAVRESGLAVRPFDSESKTDVLPPDVVFGLPRQTLAGDESFVFASNPIACNVKGWKERVSTVAVSREPRREPVHEVEYVSADGVGIYEQFEAGEEFYRQGRDDEASVRFQEIHDVDPRYFPVNFRLAQYYQKNGDAEQAREHWMAAKQANPHHPRVWAMAGVYHLLKALEMLDNALVDSTRQELKTEQDFAITDFEKARQLSRDAFDTTLEHYCVTLLAVSVLMRRTDPDVAEGRVLVDELNRWEPSSNLMAILRSIAKMLSAAASGTKTEITEASEATSVEAKVQLENLKEHECMNGDTIQVDDLDLLISIAETRLKAAKKKARLQSVDNSVSPTGSVKKASKSKRG